MRGNDNMFFTLFIVILVFVGIIYMMGKLIAFIIYRSGGILDGTGVLFLGAIRAAQYVIIWGLVTGIIGSIPFLSFFWFIPFIFTLYNLIFAFPLIFGPVVAIASGYACNEIFKMLPNLMLKYYHNNTLFNIQPLIDFNNRDVDEEPDIFLLKILWEDERFMSDLERWSNGEMKSKPHYVDYIYDENES